MNRIASIAVLAAFVAVSAPASAQGNLKGTGNRAMDAAPRQEPNRPATHVRHRARATTDARACLQFTTNIRITRCAEKYR